MIYCLILEGEYEQIAGIVSVTKSYLGRCCFPVGVIGEKVLRARIRLGLIIVSNSVIKDKMGRGNSRPPLFEQFIYS